jgi:alkylation response protein AidB-like acyl-CoA dehydrogenase
MYLAPEGDELEIASTAADFLADAMPIARLHASGSADMGPELRRQLGEMGWFALAVPEDKGGSGLSAVEHALFFREVGRQCGPVDVLAQCLVTNAIARAPDMRVSNEAGETLFSTETLLEQLVSGEKGAALVAADGEQFRLIGSPDAEWGILAGPNWGSLHLLTGCEATPNPALDPANTVRIATQLPPGGTGSKGNWLMQLGQLGVAAMLVGIAEAALDLIVEYARLRETFGRKIGSWQAVRHPCADMAVRAEAARSQLWFAAAAIKEGRGDAQAHLDAAKHCANQAALGNTDTTIQLHGGIGVTDEHDCHLLLKHALLLSRLFGGKRALLASLLHAKLED